MPTMREKKTMTYAFYEDLEQVLFTYSFDKNTYAMTGHQK